MKDGTARGTSSRSGGGAALAYAAWHAFIQQPVTGKADLGMRIGNAILALGVILLLYAAARRTSAALADTLAELAK